MIIYFFEIIACISLRSILMPKPYRPYFEYLALFLWSFVNTFLYNHNRSFIWYSLNISWYIADCAYLITFRNLQEKWYTREGFKKIWIYRCICNVFIIAILIMTKQEILIDVWNIILGIIISPIMIILLNVSFF
jgi:hypothetical protein